VLYQLLQVQSLLIKGIFTHGQALLSFLLVARSSQAIRSRFQQVRPGPSLHLAALLLPEEARCQYGSRHNRIALRLPTQFLWLPAVATIQLLSPLTQLILFGHKQVKRHSAICFDQETQMPLLQLRWSYTFSRSPYNLDHRLLGVHPFFKNLS
jgi:hypothetical protein